MANQQHPSLAYAEEQLGVHKVYSEAELALNNLADIVKQLDAAITLRSSLDATIRDREMDLMISEAAKNSELSQAALDRRMKRVYHEDQTLKELRHKRALAAADASGLDLDIEHAKYVIKVKVGRMEELGGYLNYLASVKNSEANSTKKPE